MTRKRFVKLYMGLGYPRNFATCMALISCMSGYTYAETWGVVEATERLLRNLDKLTPEERALHDDFINAAARGGRKV